MTVDSDVNLASDGTELKTKPPREAGIRPSRIFGPLWDDPRIRPLLLVNLLLGLSVLLLVCVIGGFVAVTQRNTLDLLFKPGISTDMVSPISDTLSLNVRGTPVPVVAPKQLILGETRFNIQRMALDEEQHWQYDASQKNTGYWVGGSNVNFVIGLPASDDNKTWFKSLHADQLLSLKVESATLRYRITEVGSVPADDTTAISDQSTPGVTLILLGESNNQRSIALAETSNDALPNELVPQGVPINLGDVRVTTTDHRLLSDNGTSYYQVDLQVTNLLSDVLGTQPLFTELEDGKGRRYALSEAGSTAANAGGWFKEDLQPNGEPGDTITLTAGFEVSDTLAGPELIWKFGLDKEATEMAQVVLPYKEPPTLPTPIPPTATPVPKADIKIVNANISPEGNEVRIVGEIRNLTTQTLTVALVDVKLDTAAGQAIALNSANPPFAPIWSIDPKATLPFQVSFMRPLSATDVIFTLFDEHFSIPVP